MQEIAGGPDAQGHDLGEGLAAGAFQMARGGFAGFGVKQHVEMRLTHAGDIRRAGIQGGRHIDGDAHQAQQLGDFGHVVAVAEPQRGCTKDVAGDGVGAWHRLGQRFDDLEERLIRAEVFLALIGG